MKRGRATLAAIGVGAACLLAMAAMWMFPSTEFVLGGAMINLGYRLQDRLDFDLTSHHDLTPEQIWQEVLRQNEMAASVRKRFPRSSHHPYVAMLVCMDARIDTTELTGDTRKFYYVVRTAGSVLAEAEQEMLELAVVNGVKVVVLTTHTDCAAEKAAADAGMRTRFPKLTQAVDEREARLKEFLSRPIIAERVGKGELLVKVVNIDTMTEEMRPASRFASGASVVPSPPGDHTGHE